MSNFATISLDAGGLIAWVAVGLVPGFLAARLGRGGGYGPVGDIGVGLVGVTAAVATGAGAQSLPGPLLGPGGPGFVGGLIAAALAATLAVWAVRSPSPGHQAP